MELKDNQLVMSEKVLHLTLKKKWFDMILSGEKKEEYREIKSYWRNRLVIRDEFVGLDGEYFKTYDVVCFKNGYSKTAPEIIIECLEINYGSAKSKWSDFKTFADLLSDYFVIKLGKILSTKNIKTT